MALYPHDSLIGPMTTTTVLADKNLQELDIIESGSRKTLMMESEDLIGVTPSYTAYQAKKEAPEKFITKEELKEYLKKSDLLSTSELDDSTDDTDSTLVCVHKGVLKLIRYSDLISLMKSSIDKEDV